MAVGDLTFGSQYVQSGSYSLLYPAWLDDTHFVSVYVNDSSRNDVYAKIGTIGTDGDIDWGTAKLIGDGSASYANMIHVTVLSSTNFAVAWNDYDSSSYKYRLKIVACSVSGTTITAGTPYQLYYIDLNSSYSVGIRYLMTMDSTHVYVMWDSYNSVPNSRIFSISGTTLTSINTTTIDNPEASLVMSSTNFLFQYGNDSLRVLSFDGTTTTAGTAITFNSGGNTSDVDLFLIDSTHFLIVYKDTTNSNYGTAAIGTLSGTSITMGSDYVFNSGTTYYISADMLDSSHFVVTFRDDSDSYLGKAIVGTISNDDEIAYGTEYSIATREDYGKVIATDDTHFALIFKDYANSSYGASFVGTVSNDDEIAFGDKETFYSNNIGNNIEVYGNGDSDFIIRHVDYTSSDYSLTPVAIESTISDYSYSGSGSITSSGSADSTIELSYSGSGSITSSGSATTSVEISNYSYTASGSITMSGSADTKESENFYPNYTGAGTITVSGHGLVTRDYEYIPIGSLVQTLGSANVQIDYNNFDGSGSITMSGSATTEFTPCVGDYTMTGNIYMSGTADPPFVDFCYGNYVGSGTIKVSGPSQYQYSTFNLFGDEDTFNLQATIQFETVDLDSTHYVNVYQENGLGKAVIGVRDGLDSTYGTEVQFADVYDGQKNSVISLDSTHFVIAYIGSAGGQKAILGTVDGTSITFGTPTTFSSGYTLVDIDKIDSTHFVIANSDIWNDGGTNYYGQISVGTVSGTSISFGQFNSITTSSEPFDDVNISVLNSTQVAVIYNDYSLGHGRVKIATISGSLIGFGNRYTFNVSSTNYKSIDTLDSTHFVIVYRDSDAKGRAIVGSVSGSVVTLGTEVAFTTNIVRDTTVIGVDSSNFFVAYVDQSDSYKGKIVKGSVSGTSITAGGIHTFNNANTDYPSIALLDSDYYVLGFTDVGDANKGKNIIGVVTPIVESTYFVYNPSGEITLSGNARTGDATTYFGSGTITSSGAADIERFYEYPNYIGAGTISMSGAADTQRGMEYEGAGNISISGSANVQVDHNYIGSGSITLSGTSTTEGIVEIGSGTITLSGSANVQVGYIYLSSGTISSSGDSDDQVDFNYIASGSITISGDAATEYEGLYGEYTGSGNIISSGSANAQTDKNYIGSGTIILSGEANTQADFNYIASGSITASGSANAQIGYIYLSSGTITSSGEADTSLSNTYIGSGSVTMSGAADYYESTNDYPNYVGSGTINLSGSADYYESTNDYPNYVGAGTITLSGDGEYYESTNDYPNYTGSGTITSSGSAEYHESTNDYPNYTGSGTITASGSAETILGNEYIGTGSITSSGSANVQVGHIYIGSGTITAFGSAPSRERNNFIYYPSGTITSSGSANVQVDHIYIGSGTITSSGEAETSLYYDYVGSGTITASGSATTSLVVQSKNTITVNARIVKIFWVDAKL